MHDTGFLAGAVASGGRALIAQSGVSTGVAGEIVIAVSSLANTSVAADDDIGLEGAAGAVVCVGLVC